MSEIRTAKKNIYIYFYLYSFLKNNNKNDRLSLRNKLYKKKLISSETKYYSM